MKNGPAGFRAAAIWIVACWLMASAASGQEPILRQQQEATGDPDRPANMFPGRFLEPPRQCTLGPKDWTWKHEDGFLIINGVLTDARSNDVFWYTLRKEADDSFLVSDWTTIGANGSFAVYEQMPDPGRIKMTYKCAPL